MAVERHILNRSQILFQKVLLERWQFIIERCSIFSTFYPLGFWSLLPQNPNGGNSFMLDFML